MRCASTIGKHHRMTHRPPAPEPAFGSSAFRRSTSTFAYRNAFPCFLNPRCPSTRRCIRRQPSILSSFSTSELVNHLSGSAFVLMIDQSVALLFAAKFRFFVVRQKLNLQ